MHNDVSLSFIKEKVLGIKIYITKLWILKGGGSQGKIWVYIYHKDSLWFLISGDYVIL